MRAALLLIDLQRDYLDRVGLTPHPASLCAAAADLLRTFRSRHLPIVHVWTTIQRRDLCMPHWQRQNVERCIAGTPGHEVPPLLVPEPEELVVHKRFYSAFSSHNLLEQLRERRVDTLVMAGVHLRACVRTTAIDAYQHGFHVTIAEDAVGDSDGAHAAITRQYLQERFVTFSTVETIVARIAGQAAPKSRSVTVMAIPEAIVDGRPLRSANTETCVVKSPRDGRGDVFCVSYGTTDSINAAVEAARGATTACQNTPAEERRRQLNQVAEAIELQSESFAQQITRDIGKPIQDARAEVRFGTELVRAAIVQSRASEQSLAGNGWRAARRPLGVVAAITPWNNPLAIALGKITPALLYGNSVVWKPAVPGAAIASRVIETLHATGFPMSVVNVVNGGRRCAEQLMAHSDIAGVTLTGSCEAGTAAEVIAAQRRIPLQAELGGNNAAIVWADANLPRAAELIAQAAFGSAGQRCTATRRVIVDRRCFGEFSEHFESAVSRLQWGDPLHVQTQIGPVVSAHALTRLQRVVQRFVDLGGRTVNPIAAPTIDDECQGGFYYPPTIAYSRRTDQELTMSETFGPIVVVQCAKSWEEALELCNGVSQGLVASLFSDSGEKHASFQRHVKVGMLKINLATAGADAHAPFCGWKASGVGPPEHGVGDVEFYTRWQVVYDAQLT